MVETCQTMVSKEGPFRFSGKSSRNWKETGLSFPWWSDQGRKTVGPLGNDVSASAIMFFEFCINIRNANLFLLIQT